MLTKFLSLFLLVTCYSTFSQYKTFYIVSADSSGDFLSIQQAVNSCKSFPDKRITIFVKKGVYREKVVIHSWNTNITLAGESIDSTVITFDDVAGKENNGTFYTYTVKVCGNDFIMENLTVENAAPATGQAVALHVEADRVLIKNCRILGNQDTLYAAGENSRQFYKNCYIEGTTDYIFGGATALFVNCTLHSKKNSFITAASTAEGVKFGFVFMNCNLTFAEGIDSVYLGRPWRNFAQTVFIGCRMEKGITPEGWHNWSRPEAENTVFYAEYGNSGTGADVSERVSWARILSDDEITGYTVRNIFSASREPDDEAGAWYRR